MLDVVTCAVTLVFVQVFFRFVHCICDLPDVVWPAAPQAICDLCFCAVHFVIVCVYLQFHVVQT